MQDFLKSLLTPVVANPDAISITENGHLVTLEVDPTDVGRVIGKKGAVIHHLRVLVKTYCSTHNLPVVTLVLNSPPKAE